MESVWARCKAKIYAVIDEQDFYVKDLCVQPYEISHDAVRPFGYSVTAGKKVSIMTVTLAE